MLYDEPNLDVVTDNLEHWSLRDTRHDALALLDAEGVICYLNPAWEYLGGTSAPVQVHTGEHYLAAIHHALCPGDRATQTIHRALQAILSGERDYVELEYPATRSGHMHWFLVRMSAHVVQGQRGVLVQQHDLNEHMAYE
jgi:PAS domain S-box-containing protein